MLMLLPIEVPMLAAISRTASYSSEFGTSIPCPPSASYTSSSTGMTAPLYSTVSTSTSSRSPRIRVLPVSRVPLGMRRSSTAMGSSSRRRKACPSDTACVPCTQAAMVFLSGESVLPMGVWNPVFRSPAIPSSSFAGRDREDTTCCRTCFTGRAAVRSFRSAAGAAVVCFPL